MGVRRRLRAKRRAMEAILGQLHVVMDDLYESGDYEAYAFVARTETIFARGLEKLNA